MEAGKGTYMTIRFIGSIMIVIGCGGFGFAMAATYKREERCLCQLANIFDYLSCELQYRLTPLPQLCSQAAFECSGILKKVFLTYAEELDMQLAADAELCMKAALSRFDDIPLHTKECLALLGHSLGRFNLDGQLKDLENLRQECRVKLNQFVENKGTRLRTYQTLGICAGAALAILLI